MTGRIYKASMTGAVAAKGRLFKASLTGSAPVGSKGRVYRTQLTGTAAVVIQPFANQKVEPLTPVTITAALAPGSATPDSYTWRVVSGTTVTLVGTGASRTIAAPAHSDGTFVVIGVKGVLAGVETVEQTIRIDTYPQLTWQATTSGWVATRPLVSL